jgi:hypothetical protein
MQDKETDKRQGPLLFQSLEARNRRLHDRRKHTCQGYTYISMVGWICRREHRRRSCDCIKQWGRESKPSP